MAAIWSGFGITSTSARNRSPRNTTLGAMSGADYHSIYGGSATFDGEPFADGATLVKYTYYGDADFNGKGRTSTTTCAPTTVSTTTPPAGATGISTATAGQLRRLRADRPGVQ
jgi:hypothetical protein